MSPIEEWPGQLQKFLEHHFNAAVQVTDFVRFPSGMSWITTGFVAHTSANPTHPLQLVLRVGDPAGLLAPYHAQPEYQVLSALASLPGLPIPKAIAFSDDLSFLGAPFLVLERVGGDTPQPWLGDFSGRSTEMNDSLGLDFARALGVLHGFDWRAKKLQGLDETRTLENTTAKEINYWARHAALEETRSPALMYYAMRWLLAKAPLGERLCIVHGDYRVGNFLQKEGRISAILDWELVHLGDPHEDLAWAAARTFSGGSQRVGGMIEQDQFHALYERHSGMKINRLTLRYYEVLAQFKMAAMLIGAVRRIEAGRASDIRMAAMGFQLTPTLMELNRLLRDLS
jgi:aminoglycoside phosphotransferase (APT) family kinase protein